MDLLIDIIIGIFCFGIGCLSGYLIAYFKKKGENRALTEDIARLTDEKQKVISQYEIRLEEQKKLHALDIVKRKYKFEEKIRQFTRYFKLLDEFNRKNQESYTNDIIPIIKLFYTDYETVETEDSKDSENKAIAELMNGFLKINSKISEEHVRMRNETNTLRLISSPKMNALLDDMDKLLSESFDASTEQLKALSVPEQFRNPEGAKPNQEKIYELGKMVQKKRQQLMDLMKQELDEI